ncbi:DUF3748 domain-containing protein [Pseudoxanthomonas sp. SGD-10]|nr:DUF3748 domain-containing protein [Pseudoxanthomonas sp. SGD-10]
MFKQEKQITFDEKGHLLNHTQVFSPDGRWVVYDTRNDDSKIGSTSTIEMVNIETGEIKELYHTQNQTEYGPGVGAATFSPTENKVIFIQGIRNSNKEKPYGFTRRNGVAIDVVNPGNPIYMDARDIIPPFTAGALRGGTHAHSWSGDGSMVVFTYNDYVIEQLSKNDTTVQDLRMVGVMFPKKVLVKEDTAFENNNGEMFSVIISEVKENLEPGTDEIDRAFDECWIGTDGYINAAGKRIKKAVAFQGNVRDAQGNIKTEIFIVDLPEDLTKPGEYPLEGTERVRPGLPQGVQQRRLTHLANGVQGPRHWLRSTPDGSVILFLSRDGDGFINVFSASVNGGEEIQITRNKFDVQSGINLSPDGKYVSYVAENAIFVTEITTGKSTQLTESTDDSSKPVGAVMWSPNGEKLVYNRYVQSENGNYLQVFSLDVK